MDKNNLDTLLNEILFGGFGSACAPIMRKYAISVATPLQTSRGRRYFIFSFDGRALIPCLSISCEVRFEQENGLLHSVTKFEKVPLCNFVSEIRESVEEKDQALFLNNLVGTITSAIQPLFL